MYKPLSYQQRAVLYFWTQGLSVPEMAALLDIGKRTIETHKENILKNYGVHNIFELLIEANVIDLNKLPEL